jgi:tRNA(Arg) A34 adenosine deaminase TadA
MSTPPFNADADRRCMRRAFELAREAADRGDNPFGAVLAQDGEILLEAVNREHTERDPRRHPELDLAMQACQEYDAAARAEMVMYASTEPCPMCASAMKKAGFDTVVYSVGADQKPPLTGKEPGVRAADILEDVTDVVGPVLPEDGRAIHEEFDWDGATRWR